MMEGLAYRTARLVRRSWDKPQINEGQKGSGLPLQLLRRNGRKGSDSGRSVLIALTTALGATVTSGAVAGDVCFQAETKFISTADIGAKQPCRRRV